MHIFHSFIESLKTENNSSLIETIQQGYIACFEANGEDDLTPEEWRQYKRDQRESLNKPPGTLSLTGPYPKILRPLPNQEDPIHRNRDRQIRYANDPEISRIRRKLIAEFGGYNAIKKKGRDGWRNFQIALNKELKKSGL